MRANNGKFDKLDDLKGPPLLRPRQRECRKQVLLPLVLWPLDLQLWALLGVAWVAHVSHAVEGELAAATETQPARLVEQLESVLDQTVTVELHNGKTYEQVRPLRILLSKENSQPEKMRVRLAEGGGRTWSLSSIRSIIFQGKIVYEHQAVVSREPENLSKREQAKRRAAQAHEKWLGRLAARGLKPWPTLSSQEHQAAIKLHKQRYAAVAALLPSLQLVETEHFLFCTNIPPQQVGVFIASLDRMYAWMRQTYGIPEEQRVWRGKASIFAFVREDEFIAFERQFMKNDPQAGTAGLCHSDGQRNVCIAVHQGTDADYFGVVLVHETSHGFIHCYKTPTRVPSWVNEGMAEVICFVDGAVEPRRQAQREAVPKSPAVGGSATPRKGVLCRRRQHSF